VFSSYTQGEEEKNLVYVLLGRISPTEVFSSYTQGEEEKNLVDSFPLLPGYN
jgi:hypothetical protein